MTEIFERRWDGIADITHHLRHSNELPKKVDKHEQ